MILDTNAISAFADDWPAAIAIIRSADQIAIPTVVLGEFIYGITHSTKRKQYDAWLDRLLPTCQILDITRPTAAVYATIRSELRRSGTPIPANDIWIAALAREHRLPILSRDAHFNRVSGIRRLTW